MTAFMNNVSTASNGGIMKKALIMMMISPLFTSSNVMALPSFESNEVMMAEDMVDGRSDFLGANNRAFEQLFKRQQTEETASADVGRATSDIQEATKRDLYEVEMTDVEAELLEKFMKLNTKNIVPLLKKYVPLLKTFAPNYLNLTVKDLLKKLGLHKHLVTLGLDEAPAPAPVEGGENYSKRDLYEVEMTDAEAEAFGKLKQLIPNVKKLVPLLKTYGPIIKAMAPNYLNLTVKDLLKKLGLHKHLVTLGLDEAPAPAPVEGGENYSKRDLYEVEMSDAEAEAFERFKKLIPNTKKFIPMLKKYIPLLKTFAPNYLNLTVKDLLKKLGLHKHLVTLGLDEAPAPAPVEGGENYSKRDLYEVEMSDAEAEAFGQLKKLLPNVKKLVPMLKKYVPLLKTFAPNYLNLTVKDLLKKLGLHKHLVTLGLDEAPAPAPVEGGENYSKRDLYEVEMTDAEAEAFGKLKQLIPNVKKLVPLLKTYGPIIKAMAPNYLNLTVKDLLKKLGLHKHLVTLGLDEAPAPAPVEGGENYSKRNLYEVEMSDAEAEAFGKLKQLVPLLKTYGPIIKAMAPNYLNLTVKDLLKKLGLHKHLVTLGLDEAPAPAPVEGGENYSKRDLYEVEMTDAEAEAFGKLKQLIPNVKKLVPLLKTYGPIIKAMAPNYLNLTVKDLLKKLGLHKHLVTLGLDEDPAPAPVEGGENYSKRDLYEVEMSDAEAEAFGKLKQLVPLLKTYGPIIKAMAPNYLNLTVKDLLKKLGLHKHLVTLGLDEAPAPAPVEGGENYSKRDLYEVEMSDAEVEAFGKLKQLIPKLKKLIPLFKKKSSLKAAASKAGKGPVKRDLYEVEMTDAEAEAFGKLKQLIPNVKKLVPLLKTYGPIIKSMAPNYLNLTVKDLLKKLGLHKHLVTLGLDEAPAPAPVEGGENYSKRDLYEVEMSDAEAEAFGKLKQLIPNVKKLVPLLKTYGPIIKAMAPNYLNLTVKDLLKKLGLHKHLVTLGLDEAPAPAPVEGGENYSKREVIPGRDDGQETSKETDLGGPTPGNPNDEEAAKKKAEVKA
ncbi:hypothetical protein K493DRAFT_392091 [Basidiobolus meristosporus CBS 931.73]|uniref:Uncharacterized protein n=1 Tax=Basidiobolus meristosporus CBS 931.73 TaxID=1314790 RepID=A0A1Y1WWQ5_9FUNG|nr:hypothetical protein K493DRAFT_392091 [Basidiobolus meristosporus CBS 931.73]|eukprot:ORX77835.1 hypothetical protein K493DRAFT_392091 [Basidiobolus meristosporus CBS 931.73]